MNHDKGAQIYLRDGIVYVFNYADVPQYPDVLDQCLAKYPETIAAYVLGSDVLRALEAYGRPMTVEEFKSRPGPIRSVMGYVSDRKFNEGLGSVSVDLLPKRQIYSVLPWRTQGLDSFPIDESELTLPASASAAEIGEAVLKQLRDSRKQNSPALGRASAKPKGKAASRASRK
jgi:hypothetical protein